MKRLIMLLLAVSGPLVSAQPQPPGLQIHCPSNITHLICGSGGSAVVNFATPAAASPDCSDSPTVVCTPPSGSVFPLGPTRVTARVTNACDQVATCFFTVTVVRDTTSPAIQCPTNFTVWTCEPTGAVVNFPAPAATDNLDATPTVVCAPPSGSVFPLGARIVTCTATDDCTNRGICSFTVTVRAPLLYNGLCHSPLGLAALNVNTNGELVVSGPGTNGQDGVRIDLGDSQGLRWVVKPPTSGEVDGRDFLIWQRSSSPSTAGTDIHVSKMSFAFLDGRLMVTPSAASYELKLLLRGEVVHRQAGRTGSFEIPECHHVEQEHCVGLPFDDLNPQVPYCINFLTVECDWETSSGPIRADGLEVTSEDPLPAGMDGIKYLKCVTQIISEVEPHTLHSERLMMFGSREQPSRPHRALGQARLVAKDGALTMADLGSSGGDGVAIDFDSLEGSGAQSRSEDGIGEGYIDEDFPPWVLDPGIEFQITARTPIGGGCQDSALGSLTLAALNATSAEVGIRCRPCESWLPPTFTVYNARQPVGGAVLTGSGPLATLQRLGTERLRLIGSAKLPSHPLGFRLHFSGPALFTLRNGTVLTGDEIRVLADTATPGVTDLASLELTSRGLGAFRITEERPLTALRMACPPGLMLRSCSTNPVPVSFPPPMVTGGNCTLPPVTVCVPASGSLFPPGATTVQCIVTNVCGERAVCSFTVTILADIVPPAMQCPTNVSTFTGNATGRLVYFGPLVVTDDPEANVSCAPPSGSLFPVGVTPVACTARDVCGHERSCTFTVEVTLLTLRVSFGASGPLLSWTGDAMLEAADDVTGPWLPIRGAASPYLIQFVGAKKFFRLAAPSAEADCGEVAFSPSVWNIDVPSVRIQGRFLLNSRPFPSSFLHGANFFLRRASTGDEVYLGLSNNETFGRRVVPGIYDVIYEHKIGDEVPLNTVAVVIAGLEISGDQTFDIDVPMVNVGGVFQFNGVPAPASQTEYGRVRVRDRANGALTLLGETREQTYAVRLIPGAYDLMYARATGGAVAPANPLTAFQRKVAITNNGVLNINVPVINITGAFTVNGVAAPVSATENGRVSLLDADTGAKLLLGETRFQNYDVLLIPGDYDLHYEGLTGGAVMPANSSARFLAGVSLPSDGVFNINLPVAQLSGAFRVNGVPAPDTETENARITLRQGEDTVFLGHTVGGSYQVRVLHGTYQAHFHGLTGGTTMPANTNAVLGSVVVAGATVFNINIPTARFDADVRFNGGGFPGSLNGESARIFFEDTVTGGLVPLAYDYPTVDQVSRLVVRGNYRVRYEYESGTVLPRNTFATLGSSLSVTQNVQTVIDVRAVALSGDFRLNGGSFPGGQNAAVTMRSLLPGDSLYLGGTQNGAYSTVIVPGHYAAFYNWAVGDLIPRNQNARLICPR